MKYFHLFICIFSLALSCKGQSDNLIDPYSQAEMIGGLDSLYEANAQVLKLPGACSDPGRVYVQLIVQVDGTVKQPKVAKGLCASADSLALKILKSARFKPATRYSEPFESAIIVPVPFED